jgi:hypothetical protein
MIRSDRGVPGFIDLNDLLGASDARPNKSLPLSQLEMVALHLTRPAAAAQRRRPDPLRIWRKASKSIRPGWQTAQREADLERLVDELSTEVRRLDEDLEMLLTAAATG